MELESGARFWGEHTITISRTECVKQLCKSRPAILPSLLLCDFANLQREIAAVEAAGCSALHLDVMDGVFVPNMTYGMTIVNAARQCTELPIDVHLMIKNPEKYIEAFRDAGADLMTIHVEATDQPRKLLEKIQSLDVASGIAINPQTDVEKIESCIGVADLVLAMSVEPGFGGQAFNESVLEKFPRLREMFGPQTLLQIDGGINMNTAATAAAAGVDLFVAGSAIFRTENYDEAMKQLNGELGAVNERI